VAGFDLARSHLVSREYDVTTALRVYSSNTGFPSFSDLTFIIEGESVWWNANTAAVALPVTAGTRYWLQVHVWDDQLPSLIYLNWRSGVDPVNDSFANRIKLQNGQSFEYILANITTDPDDNFWWTPYVGSMWYEMDFPAEYDAGFYLQVAGNIDDASSPKDGWVTLAYGYPSVDSGSHGTLYIELGDGGYGYYYVNVLQTYDGSPASSIADLGPIASYQEIPSSGLIRVGFPVYSPDTMQPPDTWSQIQDRALMLSSGPSHIYYEGVNTVYGGGTYQPSYYSTHGYIATVDIITYNLPSLDVYYSAAATSPVYIFGARTDDYGDALPPELWAPGAIEYRYVQEWEGGSYRQWHYDRAVILPEFDTPGFNNINNYGWESVKPISYEESQGDSRPAVTGGNYGATANQFAGSMFLSRVDYVFYNNPAAPSSPYSNFKFDPDSVVTDYIGPILHTLPDMGSVYSPWTNPYGGTFATHIEVDPASVIELGAFDSEPDIYGYRNLAFTIWAERPALDFTGSEFNPPSPFGAEGFYHRQQGGFIPASFDLNEIQPTMTPPLVFAKCTPGRVKFLMWPEVTSAVTPPMRQRHRDDGLTTDARQERGHGSSLQSSIRQGGRVYY